MSEQKIKLYSIKNYSHANKSFITNNFIEFTVNEAIKELTIDNYYNMRIKHNTQYLFFGELDHHNKSFEEFVITLQKFLKTNYALEFNMNDIKFTINNAKNSSYHFVIPKWNTTIKKLKEIFSKVKEIDTSIYCEHWFRYPNQSKGTGENGIHKIVHGNLIDFIFDVIPNNSININNIQSIEHIAHTKTYSIEYTKTYSTENITYNANAELLKKLFDFCYKPFRFDDYHIWLTVGFALKNTFDDDIAIELYDYFSRRSNKYMGISSIVKTYKAFSKNENGYTVGTLYYYAITDNKTKFLEIMNTL